MNFTSDQLKFALAKMAPDIIDVETLSDGRLFSLVWKKEKGWPRVKDTELLHICRVIALDLPNEKQWLLTVILAEVVDPKGPIAEASWLERAFALSQIKGIEL